MKRCVTGCGRNCQSPRVEQRDETKQANNVGTKEYLSSVKAKKGKRREERGEKKRSELRGGVERGLNVPDKSIEYAAKSAFPVARRAVRDDHPTPSQRRAWHAGMQHRLPVNNARCEAPDGPSPLCVR